MHSPSEVRYRFGPLERRGLIGSLGPGQLLILAAAVLLTIVLVQALKSGAGLALGMVVLSGGALASFVPYQGRTLNEWMPVLASFFGRRLGGRHHYRSPARAAGTYAATIQARARSFVLLDPADKASRLAGWAGVVAGLAREGSPVSRVQWIERTVPDDRNSLTRYLRDAIDPSIGLDAAPLQSYLRLTQAASPVTEQHELYVVVQVSASKASRAIKQAGGRDTGACVVLARELETFARRLEGAEIEVLPALGPGRLAATIRLAFDPHSRPGLARLGTLDPSREEGVSARNAWPRQTETRWSYYRTNDVVHSTYWIAEWPRLEVGPDFLAPLLVQTRSMRTVSVTMEPVPPLKAMRAVGFAKTADVADEELRQKLGFIGTAKRRNQSEAVARREQELADGHADVRFSGWITVTAESIDGLQEACAEIEHAAGQSRLELQRCDGEQDICFPYARPLGSALK